MGSKYTPDIGVQTAESVIKHGDIVGQIQQGRNDSIFKELELHGKM